MGPSQIMVPTGRNKTQTSQHNVRHLWKMVQNYVTHEEPRKCQLRRKKITRDQGWEDKMLELSDKDMKWLLENAWPAATDILQWM